MSEPVREQCAWVGCDDLSEAEIAGRPLCSHHFYLVAQRRLSALLGLMSDDEADRTLPLDVQRFLSELVSETETLTSQSQRLTPERLEELLKLSVKAAELHKMIKGQSESAAVDVQHSSGSPAEQIRGERLHGEPPNRAS